MLDFNTIVGLLPVGCGRDEALDHPSRFSLHPLPVSHPIRPEKPPMDFHANIDVTNCDVIGRGSFYYVTTGEAPADAALEL